MVQTPTTHKRFLALLLLAMVAVVYLPSTRNSFVWDDDYYITHNMTLSGVSGLRRIWLEPGATPQYYPLVFTSFWLEYHLFGLNPAVFHTTNILLHAANALLAWLVLSRLRIPWAWVAAAIFAIHPVNVESVAWVSERKNVLSGFFVLLSLLFLIDALIPSGRETRTGKRLLKPWLPGVAAFLFFVPALLSKSVTSMMPVVFLLLAWWKTPETWFRKALALAPFFIAGGAAGLHTVVMEKAHVGAHGVEWYFSMADRILIATRALWFYAGKLAFPVNMVFIYPRWEIDASAPLQYLFPLATLALLAWLWTARLRIGRGPLTGVAIFVVTLFPALGFINYYPMRYSFVADHFQYLAGIAMIALATAGGHVILSAGGSHRNRKTAWALCAGLLLLLGVRTFQEQAKYENFRTLWRDTLIKNPECWMAHNNLGTLLSKIGEYERATTHFQESLRIYPMNIMARLNLEAMSGKHDPTTSAQLLYTNSAARPVQRVVWYNRMADLMEKIGQQATAEAYRRKTLAIDPGNTGARYRLGQLLEQRGESGRAKEAYETVLKWDPLHTGAYDGLGRIAFNQGRYDEAVDRFSILLRIDPYRAKTFADMGLAYYHKGEPGKAVRAYRLALNIQPYSVEIRAGLARILAQEPPLEHPQLLP